MYLGNGRGLKISTSLIRTREFCSTKIIGVGVLLTWDVMDVEKNVALDLLDGDQFDNVGEDFRIGETMVDVSFCSSVV